MFDTLIQCRMVPLSSIDNYPQCKAHLMLSDLVLTMRMLLLVSRGSSQKHWWTYSTMNELASLLLLLNVFYSNISVWVRVRNTSMKCIHPPVVWYVSLFFIPDSILLYLLPKAPLENYLLLKNICNISLKLCIRMTILVRVNNLRKGLRSYSSAQYSTWNITGRVLVITFVIVYPMQSR